MKVTKDARAVENPMSAMFDLADEVYDQAPRMRRMIKYAIGFALFWWFINLILTFYFMATIFVFGLAMLAILVVGIVALQMLFRAREFLNYYEERHRHIQAIRSANPEIKIPEGKTPVERALAYLKEKNSGVRQALRDGNMQFGAQLHSQAGPVAFDAYAMRRASAGWRYFDIGEKGFAVYMKLFQRAPTLDEVRQVEGAVAANTAATGTPPDRVVLLLTAEAEDALADDVYDYITNNAIRTKYAFSEYFCSMQIIAEGQDGTYDFIPFIAEGA